ncbi:uncharacterized protein EV420DRAFT_1765780 [Desarmillaria tabescens]|uniref:DUF6534 domain-containing protein n=1 Tax=Armillaria tabescens TaxID=1929756 RepID=A0AA39K4I7_ARMTA|nr:uncharacterized protein EV420DRAFT_1765780 [Desarmillaria tabescens]KAK0454208.1 hypothetical protein EV420DRAFT_1765780 [Desarmillaria tabescens]
MSFNVSSTYGAVAIGALSASLLSGAVAIQTIFYYKLYPSDLIRVKTLVFAIWLLDTCHTCFVWVSLWYMLISHYGSLDIIPWSIGVSIVITAVLTFLVHWYAQTYYDFPSSTQLPVAIASSHIGYLCQEKLAPYMPYSDPSGIPSRFCLWFVYETLRPWIFTLGLVLSSAVDMLITGSLFGLLHKSRSEAEKYEIPSILVPPAKTERPSLNAIIDALILYTFETGSLTCVATIIDMICWITMSSNLIFMGLHFVISKLYANSLLATLNTRRGLRRGQWSSSGRTGSAIMLNSRQPRDRVVLQADPVLAKRGELQINVERSIHCSTDY